MPDLLHIPDRRAAKIVAVAARHAGSIARRRPRLPKVAPALAQALGSAEIREQERDYPLRLPLDDADAFKLGDEERFDLEREIDYAAIVVFRCAWIEA